MPSKTHQDILLMRWALFSVAGIILIVVLYSLGVTPAWAQALKGAMASAPFLLAADAPALSPGMGFLLCIALTLALVYDLILIRGTLRKTAVLAAFLLLLACFTPVLGLPALLKKQGYTTIHCGKAHFGSKNTPGANPKLFGFDYNIAGTEIGGPADYRGSQKYGTGNFHVRGLDENNYYENDVFLTEALTQEVLKRLDAIRNNPKEADKPFYLYMSHYAIHAPFDMRGYDKRFAEDYSNPNDGHNWSDNEKRYSALIQGMDKSLGDIMKYLKEHDMDKNTVLVFMSDNGGLAISGRLGNEDANYPLSFGKGSCMEGGIREPMIVSWPGVTKGGSRCAVPVVIDDFFPTLLDIAGCRNAKVPQKLDGLSLVPLLKGGRFPADRPLLFHQPNNWGENNRQAPQYGASTALRHGDWKLIYRHGNQSFELYNFCLLYTSPSPRDA